MSTGTTSSKAVWVTARALQALAEHTIVEGGMFTAGQLADWTAPVGRLDQWLTNPQRVHATSRLCALGFVRHHVRVLEGQRTDCYTVTAEGAAAIEAAASGHVRKSGPKGTRTPNPPKPGALATRLWALVRVRRIVDSDAAARTLCTAGEDEFKRVRATVRRTLRRWELAGYLEAGARRVKAADEPPTSNGSKRYVLIKDTGPNPPRWTQPQEAAQ